LGEKTILERVVERVKVTHGVDETVVAVPVGDQLLRDYACGVPVVYGDEHDVLKRYFDAAQIFQADVIMRVTADCPFYCPDVGASVLKALPVGGVYASNDTRDSGFPDGTDCEVFSMEALERAHRTVVSPADREHVTPMIQVEAQNRSRLTMVTASQSISHNLSIDTLEEYRFAAHLWPRITSMQYSSLYAAILSLEERVEV
jgi:spore coat polysaccharide biosynthesis protein SpsF